MITELGLLARTASPKAGSNWLIAADAGLMRNRTRSWATGWTASAVSDDVGWRVGLSPRARLWLDPEGAAVPFSLDLSAGVFLLGQTNFDEYRWPPSYSVGAGLNYGDMVALTARLEALQLKNSGTDWNLSGGIRCGWWLAPLAGAVGLGAALIVSAGIGL